MDLRSGETNVAYFEQALANCEQSMERSKTLAETLAREGAFSDYLRCMNRMSDIDEARRCVVAFNNALDVGPKVTPPTENPIATAPSISEICRHIVAPLKDLPTTKAQREKSEKDCNSSLSHAHDSLLEYGPEGVVAFNKMADCFMKSDSPQSSKKCADAGERASRMISQK